MIKGINILIPSVNITPSTKMEHVATRWQISYSPRMDDTDLEYYDKDSMIIDTITYRKPIENSADKWDNKPITSFMYEIDGLTKDTMIYARYQIILEIPDSKSPNGKRTARYPWSAIMPLKGDQEGFKISNVVISVPRIYLEEDFSTNKSGNLKLSTSEIDYYMGYGKHTSTTWKVESVDGEKIFEKKIELRENEKGDITLPLNLFELNKGYIISAIHGNHVNWTSLPGKTLYVRGLYKENMYKLLPMVQLVENRKLQFQVVLTNPKFKSIDILIKHKGEIVYSLLGHKTLYPMIEINNLNIGENYEISSRLEYSTGKYTPWRVDTNLIAKENIPVDINPFIEYQPKYSFVSPFMISSARALFSKELLVTGGFIIPKGGLDENSYKGFGYYRIEDDQLRFIKNISNESIFSNEDIKGGIDTTVVPLYNGDFIINHMIPGTKDTKGKTKGSLWSKYSVNPVTLKFEKLISKEVLTDVGCIGNTSGVAVLPNNTIYYVPNLEMVATKMGPVSLYKINPDTMEVAKECDLPFIAKSSVSLCAIDKENILIISGSDTPATQAKVRTNDILYKYNTKTGEFINLLTITDIIPNTIYNIHMVLRRDGNVLLFNNTDTAIGSDQSTYVYNIKENTLTKEDNDNPDNRPYTKTLLLNNGSFYRISTGEIQPEQIYCYGLRNTTINPVGEAIINEYIDVLNVNDGDYVIIENIYKYSNIIIKGTGKVVWVDGNRTLEITSDTKIIMNTTRFTLDDMKEVNVEDTEIKNNVMVIEPSYLVFEDIREKI